MLVRVGVILIVGMSVLVRMVERMAGIVVVRMPVRVGVLVAPGVAVALGRVDQRRANLVSGFSVDSGGRWQAASAFLAHP
jgi:hypothetical protein